jgi:TMEM175 potassium channel family protein
VVLNDTEPVRASLMESGADLDHDGSSAQSVWEETHPGSFRIPSDQGGCAARRRSCDFRSRRPRDGRRPLTFGTMGPSAGEQARTREFERLLTFIDAIVAIAITLLVLPLVELVGDVNEGDSVWRMLLDNKAPIGAFFLSFGVIANLWLIQHRILHHVVATSEPLTRTLILWTLTIVFLPFPTALAAGPHSSAEQAATKALYVGTMAVSSMVLSLMALAIARSPRLRDGAVAPDPMRAFGTSITFLVALAVMLTVPASGYWPLLLLLVPDRAVALWRRLAHRAG